MPTKVGKKLNKAAKILLAMPAPPHERPIPIKSDLERELVLRNGRLVEK